MNRLLACSLILLAAPTVFAAPYATYSASSGKVKPEARYQIDCSIFPEFVRQESQRGLAKKTTSYGKVRYTSEIKDRVSLVDAIEEASGGVIAFGQGGPQDGASESYKAALPKLGAEPLEVILRSSGTHQASNQSPASDKLIGFIQANCFPEEKAPVLASYAAGSGFVDPEKQYSITCEIRSQKVTYERRDGSGKVTKSREWDVLPTDDIRTVEDLFGKTHQAAQVKFTPLASSTDGPTEIYRSFRGSTDATNEVVLYKKGPSSGQRKSPAAKAVVEFIRKNCQRD